MKILKILFGLAVAALLSIAGFLFAMRFADGPWGIVAGGAFKTGTLVSDRRPDCAVLKDRGEVQFQLLEPSRSRTTWIACYEDRVFIPSGYMQTSLGKLWKHWPREALEQPEILLRIDDEIYPLRLERITEDPAIPVIVSELGRKYMLPADASDAQRQAFLLGGQTQVSEGNLWIFELLSDATSSGIGSAGF